MSGADTKKNPFEGMDFGTIQSMAFSKGMKGPPGHMAGTMMSLYAGEEYDNDSEEFDEYFSDDEDYEEIDSRLT